VHSFPDSGFRRNDKTSQAAVIPAKAGIQEGTVKSSSPLFIEHLLIVIPAKAGIPFPQMLLYLLNDLFLGKNYVCIFFDLSAMMPA